MSDAKENPYDQYGLIEAPVEIKTAGASLTVPGLTHESCPGLAVTMRPFGAFTVTHIASGLKMCSYYERASRAILVMSEYALIAESKGVSWAGLDKDESIRLITDAFTDEVPFDGYTVTNSEGVKKQTIGEWRSHLTNGFFDEFPWEETDPFEVALDNFEKVGAKS